LRARSFSWNQSKPRQLKVTRTSSFCLPSDPTSRLLRFAFLLTEVNVLVRDFFHCPLMQLGCRQKQLFLLSSLSFFNLCHSSALAMSFGSLATARSAGLLLGTVALPPHCLLRCRQRATNHRLKRWNRVRQVDGVESRTRSDLFAAQAASGRLLAKRSRAHGPKPLIRGYPTAT
jgi:hypothetical protein